MPLGIQVSALGDQGRQAVLRVELLGPVRVMYAGDEIGLGPGRQRAVFAVLAMRAGQAVSRAELVEAVWGRSAPASADGSVYTYVSGLRRALGRDLIASAGSGYSLRVHPRQVDTRQFEELCDQANVMAAKADHRGVATALGEALMLWRGEAFAGVPGPFAEQERTRLEQAWLRAVETFAAARLELGAHVEVAAELETLIREHPLRESLRELLMVALSRSGRHAEALEVFADTRATLLCELGTEPGPALRQVHSQVLAGNAFQAQPVVARLSVKPCGLADEPAERLFVGRQAETQLLRERIAQLQAGRGGAVWIEGEPGIGKSELLLSELSGVESLGTQIGWAVADELAGRFPLQIVLECLGMDRKSPAREPIPAIVERICATAPLVLVIDDIQWADEASVQTWRRLCEAASHLPLLLVCCANTGHGRTDLLDLRRQMESDENGRTIVVGPLSFADSESLLSLLVGARPGRMLRRIASRADGNPLYLREVVGALLIEDAIEIVDGVAHVDDCKAEDAPRSLIAAVERSSKALSESTKEMLLWVAVLGPEATVGNIATVSERPVWYLVRAVADAVAANVIAEDGPRLGFRHQLIRDTVYGAVAAPTRAVLHRQAAKVLADAGAPPHRVSEQLVAAGGVVEPWVAGWLVDHGPALAARAPLIAAELLDQVIDHLDVGDPRREILLAAQVRVLFQLSRDPEAKARHALAMSTDPVRSAEMRQLLAAIVYRQGRREEAIAILTEVPLEDDLPDAWRLRHKALLAYLRRDISDVGTAEVAAKAAYEQAVDQGDGFLAAHALQTRWLVDSVRRDHVAALRHVEEAIAVVEDDPRLIGMQFDLLDNRIYTLQNLDLLDEADAALGVANELAAEQGLPIGLHVTTAVHHYWKGRWDEALQALDAVTGDGPSITYAGLLDAGPARLLQYGLSALIAARRGNHIGASAHLEAAEHWLVTTNAERESFDFLLAARALVATQLGDMGRAFAELAPVLQPAFAGMMLRHQWLPALVRVAVELGDQAKAEQALEVAEFEAAREPVQARAFCALLRCQALILRDPEPGLVATEHYRRAGRPMELASALGDVAELFAERGLVADARAAFTEAAEIFTGVGAKWDLGFTTAKLNALGVPR
ncbi:DNA-binding SARP family transcriptional activator/tetratricopeptide (TPR) repeat protein [Kibdelosporangium banguiense]|uniref:DNA-binding SARP family transcriptional activator/tetratricopeptide (TPR) repeat protein n=1 Tax=Kibdelosporangium banguiense TaxID=1365924 RepID=A0ABS4TK37_9PSEU|nr:BTAD domain-containing putative transcriptional regulator [Kibdelosporangium banguiense]MBP2324380.1 DNA-binding SARP family transcriptional activator/tetratricopeptide (TPR) repeat protein [Kibdelosporangium banguiense]